MNTTPHTHYQQHDPTHIIPADRHARRTGADPAICGSGEETLVASLEAAGSDAE
jgi:hypothetical protein